MKKILIIIFFTAFGTIVSCKKLVSIDSPPDQLTPDKVFNNASSVTAATVDVYTQLGTVDQNFIPPVGTYTDELINTRVDATSSEFTKSLLTPVNTSVLSVWQNLYSTIYKANAIVAGLQGPVTIPDSIKNQCLGEALFIRAYGYFLLTNIFGDVPLITTTNVTENASAKRTSSVLIYQQLIADLKQAAVLLPTAYTGDGEKVRANKWVATALLAKAYLFNGNFPNAESQASLIINSGQYSLTDLNNVFLANSNETILQLWNINGYTNLNSVPFSGVPTYQVATPLLNSFESGDNRSTAWINSTTLSGTTYYYPYKYKLNSPSSGGSSEYTMYLRLGEVYLIRAEARDQENNVTGAASDLNIIRSRAGLSNTLASTQSAMLSAIYHERQVELFDEGGNRFFDLKRAGTINTVLGQLKPLWKPTGNLFPIPQSEELKDPFLTQNPGYTN